MLHGDGDVVDFRQDAVGQLDARQALVGQLAGAVVDAA
jgi:hypothetical protein